MDSGIIVYSRTITAEKALDLLFEKIKGPNFAIFDDISKVEPGEDLCSINLYILASWGTTREQLARVLEWYPTLKLYRINDVNDILPLYVCKHDGSQLNTCLAKYSHTKQLLYGNLPRNKIINGFRISDIDQFNQKNKGLYVSNIPPAEISDIEHLHMIGNIDLSLLQQWLSRTYTRISQTIGKNEKMTVHLYGDNLNYLIEQIRSLDYIYDQMYSKASKI